MFVGIVVGIGVCINNVNMQKLVNGIFDVILLGILMYIGLVELLVYEFMFNLYMCCVLLKIQLFVFGCVFFGVGVMVMLVEWV